MLKTKEPYKRECSAPDFMSGAFYIYGVDITMDDLLQKYNEYMRLENCRIEYKLANGQNIEEKNSGEFNHLGIALDSNTGNRYIETFFHQPSDMYITGQKVVKVNGFALYDSNNHLIVEDSF